VGGWARQPPGRLHLAGRRPWRTRAPGRSLQRALQSARQRCRRRLERGALSHPASERTVAEEHLRLAEAAHAKDVVTAILADFRGLDTVGEITVVAVVLLGVATLLNRGRLTVGDGVGGSRDATGVMVLALLDGRRPLVGWLAVAGLGVSLVSTVLLTMRVLREGPVEVVTGGWRAGVGIVMRADALGVVFAMVSVRVILVCLLYELSLRVRSRTFPAVISFMAAGLSGLFLTGDAFNFYVSSRSP